MATHNLELDVDYNVAVDVCGAGKFNEDKGTPDTVLDPTSDHSISNAAVCEALDEKTTIREVASLPSSSIYSDCFYRVVSSDRVLWYDPVNLAWVDLTAVNDPYCIVERTEDFRIYAGVVASYADLPAASSKTGKVMYATSEAMCFMSDGTTWNATTDYIKYRSDCYYKKTNLDDVYWFMPAGQTWISILNGTGTGEANIIESVSVNGTALTITNKDVDASTLANKIESISVNGVAQTIDVNKNVELTVTGEVNKIEKITRNGVEVPIVSKAVNITVNDDAEENVIEGIKYNGTLVNIDANKIATITGAGEENIIKTISVNGTNIPPDAAKNVNITMSTLVSPERGLSSSTTGIGHSNTAIAPLTTQKIATLAIDEYGHVTAYTAKTLGNGISDTSNTIGHANSITASTTKAIRSFGYDAYGHVVSSDDVQLDTTPTSGSSNLMTSGSIYNVVGNIAATLAGLNDGAGA